MSCHFKKKKNRERKPSGHQVQRVSQSICKLAEVPCGLPPQKIQSGVTPFRMTQAVMKLPNRTWHVYNNSLQCFPWHEPLAFNQSFIHPYAKS